MENPEKDLAIRLACSKVDGDEFDRRLVAAQSGIDAVGDGFADWALEDVVRAQAQLDRLENGSGDETCVREIFRVVHDLKGQGSTFGFTLLTTIGAPFCDFLRSAASMPTADQLVVIRAHLVAYQTILQNDIRGNGGEAGRRLVDKLAASIARVPPLGGVGDGQGV